MIFGLSEWSVLLATLVVLCGYYYWKKTQYFAWRGILATNTLPVFGDTLLPFIQMGHIIDLMTDIYTKFPTEKYVGMFSFSTPVILIRDLELLKQISVKDFDHFSDHVEFVDPEVDPLTGKMLFLLKGEQWREMRNTLSPAFTSSKMRAMFPFMQECSDNLLQYLDRSFETRPNKNVDYIEMEVKETFTRCTNDIIATCGFGIQTNSLDGSENEFYKMSKSFVTFDWIENMKLAVFTFLPIFAKIFRIEFGKKGLNQFFKKLVIHNIKEREEKHIIRQDMIHLLMLAKQGKLSDDNAKDTKPKTQLTWSDDEITAQVMIFLFAGLESTATMLSYLAYELAKNPQVQNRLLNEIDDFVKQCDGKINYEGINNLKYLDMVCSETLRLWPVAPNTDRVCSKPYELPPQSERNPVTLKLNKGDQIWIPTVTIQRDPKYFPNPDKFDPERFSDENKDSIVPFSYIPFGMGPRQCIGTRFALLEVKILITNLLMKYQLVKTPKTPDPIVLRNGIFDMLPVDGYWVGLKPRNKSVPL